MEPILIGAALGAGTSAITGGDPLTGAIIGGATGGIGSGVGGATAGTVVPGGATAIPASGMSSAAGIGGATSYGATIGGVTLPATSTAGIPTTVAPNVLSDSGAAMLMGTELSSAGYSALPIGQKLSLFGDSLSGLGDLDLDTLSGMGNMMGGQQEQQQQTLSAPPIRRGQQVNVSDPIFALLEEQRRPQQRGRISLL
jgi:hypothetical protein